VVDTSETLDSLNARALRFEISPTGPMFGEKMLAAGESIAQAEVNAARAFAVTPELFSASSHPPSGERRPLRIAIENAALDSGIDEFGGYIRIAFDLPPGAFATTVLKELFGPIRTNVGTHE
jgi:tRNA pseudouridine13 synthase